ncbi:MAG: 50S ribosomal protein L6 [Magnetococcus sp. DMHC-6]
MSRIGKKPVVVPTGVEVNIRDQEITVKGQRGTWTRAFHPHVQIELKDGQLIVKPRLEGRKYSAVWGLSRSVLANMVTGVSTGFTKEMEIIGVGYRATVADSILKLNLGYSHPIDFILPDGVTASVDKNTFVSIHGMNPETIGQVCADIRKFRPPEPYKGKGVRYTGEFVLRKVGKKK